MRQRKDTAGAPPSARPIPRRRVLGKVLAGATMAGPAFSSAVGVLACGIGGPSTSVGSKTYSEQLILGELMARLLEQRGLFVSRRFLMQTPILHAALTAGDLDCYVEYTGTAYMMLLKQTFHPGETASEIHERVRALYAERFGLAVGPPIGFSNDYVIALRPERAAELGLSTISDLSRSAGLTLVAGHPFFEREDGYAGMLDWYGFETPPETVAVDLDLVWHVLESGQADVLVGNSTDGRLARLGLTTLADDRSWFPPYQSAVVYRPDAAPEVAALATRLAGAIDNDTMRALNRRVDVERERPSDVAADFIASRGLTL